MSASSYEYIKAWRKRNKDKVAAQARRYRAKHPEKIKAIKRRRMERHGDEIRAVEAEQARKRRALNPEGQRARFLAWRARRELKLAEIAGRPRPDCCDICGGALGGIVFDHCHQSGRFRGWLCDRCNRVLGIVYDDPALLRDLASYLEKSNGETDCQSPERPPEISVCAAGVKVLSGK